MPTMNSKAEGQDDRDDPDQRVEQKDAAPSDVLGEDAPKRRADGKAYGGDSRPDSDRPRFCLGIGKRGADQCERRNIHARGTDALEATRHDEHCDIG
jgi:hypothetical protein